MCTGEKKKKEKKAACCQIFNPRIRWVYSYIYNVTILQNFLSVVIYTTYTYEYTQTIEYIHIWIYLENQVYSSVYEYDSAFSGIYKCT